MQGTQVQSLVHPWSRKIPHASEQLSPSQLVTPCATTTEAYVPRDCVLCNKRAHNNEKPIAAMNSDAHSTQLEKTCM